MGIEKSRPSGGGYPNKLPAHEATASPLASSNTLEAAKDYADQGIPVFFLSSTKRPLANCRSCDTAGPDHAGALCDHLICHGHLAATCDPQRLQQMARNAPHGMLGIRTGAVSGLVVVDVDPRHGGDESLAGLIAAGLLPPTARVVTGASGQHLYYRHPGQRITSRPLPGWPGVDIKGDGGYVIAPPSTHPRTGRRYVQVDDGRTPVEMASALVKACSPKEPALLAHKPTAVDVSPVGGIRAPDRLLSKLLATVHQAPAGARRTTLYGAAHGVARLVIAGALSGQDGYDALLHACHQAGWEVNKGTCAAIRDGFRAEGVTL